MRCLVRAVLVSVLSLLFTSTPARAQLSPAAEKTLEEGIEIALDAIEEWAARGKGTGLTGPLRSILKDSDELICASWTIAFATSLRNAMLNGAPVEIQERYNELRWKITALCEDKPRVGTTPISPLPPTTPRKPDDDLVDDRICRDKCHGQWVAFTTAANAAADAQNKANTDAAEAQKAQGALDNLMASAQGLRGDVEAQLRPRGLDRMREAVRTTTAAKAKSAAEAAAARGKRDAAEAAWRQCLESCRKRAKSYRTPIYVAAGAGVTAVALMAGGGSTPPVMAAQTPAPPAIQAPAPAPAPPVSNTPAPSPAPAPAPPAAPPNPGGVYQSSTNVASDPGGHAQFVALDPQVMLNVNVNGQSVSIAGQGNTRWIASSGAISPDGTFTTSGTGSAAGFPGVAVTFNGRIDASSSPMRMTGDYTVGTNGALPGGQSTRYSISGQKAAVAVTGSR